MKNYILVILLFNIFCVNAQDKIPEKSVKSLFITGITYDGETLQSLPGTNYRINNLNNFATDKAGRFSFYGAPGDTVVFTYMGYQPSVLIVPDTLKSKEYVVGIFMHDQPVVLSEIIILSRLTPSSIIIKPVRNDQKTLDIAQSNVDKAAVEGLTRAPKVYDADMNVKKTLRTNQMRTENKGMLVTPENSVGLSTLNYQIYNIFFGIPIITQNKVAREIVTDSEIDNLLSNFRARKATIPLP